MQTQTAVSSAGPLTPELSRGPCPAVRQPPMVVWGGVQHPTRWRSEVSSFAPDRLEEFDELIATPLNNPAPVQRSAE